MTSTVTTHDAAPAVELRGVTKRFGSVVACRDVDLTVQPGEVHGLLGENGAGKTTLMKILIGLVPPDRGTVSLGGTPVVVRDPAHAASLGLVMAQQHFTLVGRLTVWENVALAHGGAFRRRQAIRTVTEVGNRYGVVADPEARVDDLTVGQRQRVELVKWLSVGPKVLILDEPTSVLTGTESRELFTELRRIVAREQLAVILISHNLDEVLRSTDRLTVLRDGGVVASLATAEAGATGLARAMVGHPVLLAAARAAVGLGPTAGGDDTSPAPRPSAPVDAAGAGQSSTDATTGGAPPALRLAEVTVRAPGGRLLLDRLSLTVDPGEIVGVVGVEGNGQSALGDLMSGLTVMQHGRIEVAGGLVPARAAALLAAGVGVIPEDPRASGLVLSMSVEENLVATDLDHYRRGFLLNRRAIRRQAEEAMQTYGISAPSARAAVGTLSGGNQQRVVVARELSRRPRVLVTVQATRGLDVQAIEQLIGLLRQAADGGAGILFISTELDQLLTISDRLVVLHAGRVVGEMPRRQIDTERLGLLMGGQVA